MKWKGKDEKEHDSKMGAVTRGKPHIRAFELEMEAWSLNNCTRRRMETVAWFADHLP